MHSTDDTDNKMGKFLFIFNPKLFVYISQVNLPIN